MHYQLKDWMNEWIHEWTHSFHSSWIPLRLSTGLRIGVRNGQQSAKHRICIDFQAMKRQWQLDSIMWLYFVCILFRYHEMTEFLLAIRAALLCPHSLKQPIAERLYKQKHAWFADGGSLCQCAQSRWEPPLRQEGVSSRCLSSFTSGVLAVNLSLARN